MYVFVWDHLSGELFNHWVGDKRGPSLPAVLQESDPLLAFAKVPQVFCSGANKTLYLSQINSSRFSVWQGGGSL